MSDITEIENELNAAIAERDAQVTTENQTNENANEEQNGGATADAPEVLSAPEAYTQEFKDSFNTLAPNWQKYLIQREDEQQKGISRLQGKLGSYKYIDDAFNANKDYLLANGINSPKEYNDLMHNTFTSLISNPEPTLKSLANSYGYDLQPITQNRNDDNPYANEFAQIKQELQDLKNYRFTHERAIQAENRKKADQLVAEFASAKDESGNPKHPYFEDVRQDMFNIIRSGLESDLDKAYERAIWANNDIRAKIIASQNQENINSKVAEAAKAKDAAFKPTSKSQANEKDLSIEDELRQRFKEKGLI